ncbi:hypothetical protein F4695_004322 [Rhizobium soli]|uniref:Uncharacterized protein n=1 Tax=Rhizobium soli TaxID=424798 RepID=A0A7X0JPF4_9HYPH|nr:hypothetical protein [Rhizobium soli]MBB6510930.1 hypothetical protein [Rhizobium soli]
MKTTTPSNTNQPPRVGTLLATSHIEHNTQQFERFLDQIRSTEAGAIALGTESSRLAISVEPCSFEMMTKAKALRLDSDCYRFVVSFAAGTSVDDVASAFDKGALAHLASIQLQVGLVNQMVGAGYALDSWELQTVLDDISEDAKVIGGMVEEGRQLHLPFGAAPDKSEVPIRIVRRTRRKRVDRDARMNAASHDAAAKLAPELRSTEPLMTAHLCPLRHS